MTHVCFNCMRPAYFFLLLLKSSLLQKFLYMLWARLRGLSTQQCSSSLSLVLDGLTWGWVPTSIIPKGHVHFQGSAESCRQVPNVACPLLLSLNLFQKQLTWTGLHASPACAGHCWLLACAGIWRSYAGNLNSECRYCWALHLYWPKARGTMCCVFE